jgi:uncharacterized protein with HEPN domain
MRNDLERLRDILEAIDAIQKYTSDGRGRFDEDELVQSWCLRHIEIIGEATSRLSKELRTKYPVAPWRNIIGMRNALMHGYFDIDWDIVWGVVANELRPLRKSILDIISSEEWVL